VNVRTVSGSAPTVGARRSEHRGLRPDDRGHPKRRNNLVACKLAQQLFNVPTRIVACARPTTSPTKRCWSDGFDVDLAICPEQVLTDYIVKLIEFPEPAVLEFAHGKSAWSGARVPGGPLVGHL